MPASACISRTAAPVDKQGQSCRAYRWPPDDTAQATRTLYQEKVAALDAALRRDFAAVLAKRRLLYPAAARATLEITLHHDIDLTGVDSALTSSLN